MSRSCSYISFCLYYSVIAQRAPWQRCLHSHAPQPAHITIVVTTIPIPLLLQWIVVGVGSEPVILGHQVRDRLINLKWYLVAGVVITVIHHAVTGARVVVCLAPMMVRILCAQTEFVRDLMVILSPHCVHFNKKSS